jgi:hypothetical protein
MWRVDAREGDVIDVVDEDLGKVCIGESKM